MRRMQGNQRGFTAVEGIIIVVVVLTLAFGGWWVWQKNRDNNVAANNNEAQNEVAESETEKNVQTAVSEGWLHYKDSDAGFSFYYPPEWGNIEETSEETQKIGGGKNYKFSKLSDLTFGTHSRDRGVSSLEFGIIAPAVIDVYTKGGTPFVRLAPGGSVTRNFTSEQVVKELGNGKVCLDEDYYASDYVEDPNPVNNHKYFAYCGLVSTNYGAVVFSTNRTDTTEQQKDNIKQLLGTFETF